MQQILIGILVAIFYIWNFLCFGMLIVNRKDRKAILEYLPFGFVAYFALFGVITLFFKIALLPLSALTITWCIVLGGVYCVIFLRKKNNFVNIYNLFKYIKKNHLRELLIFIVVIAAQLLFICLKGNMSMYIDNSFYIGQSATDIYTNTIDQYSPYSGEKLEWLFAKNIYVSYMAHRAMVGQVFHLAPLVEYNFCMPIAIFIIVNLIILIILLEVGNKLEDIFWAYIVTVEVGIVWAYYEKNPFIYSTSDGKFSIFPYIIVPLYLLIILRQFGEQYDKKNWFILFLVNMAANTIASTCVYMTIAATGILGITWIFKRHFKGVGYIMLSIMPSLIIALVYVINQWGYLIRYIPA